MTGRPRISLDAMGGDNAPEIVIAGADRALRRHPDMDLILVGDESKIKPLIMRSEYLKTAEIIHTDEEVLPEDKPSQAVRSGRNSSMWLAIQNVAEGRADAVVSAGNTGALMAMSKLQLRMMEGITRPAIAAFFPTKKGASCMLDMGANIECNEDNLVQFAIMGSAFVKTVLNIKNPSVGLLNVGEEEQKGFDYLRLAANILDNPKLGLNYTGFVEGSDLGEGNVDVFVTDGFTGNVALKTAEGVAELFQHSLRRSFDANWLTRLAYLVARPVLRDVRKQLDPRAHNGAVFLGLNGISVKSHGGTDKVGFANAVHVAAEMIEQRFIPDVSEHISQANQILENERPENDS